MAGDLKLPDIGGARSFLLCGGLFLLTGLLLAGSLLAYRRAAKDRAAAPDVEHGPVRIICHRFHAEDRIAPALTRVGRVRLDQVAPITASWPNRLPLGHETVPDVLDIRVCRGVHEPQLAVILRTDFG